MSAQTCTFGPFRLYVRQHQLVCDRRAIALRGKVFDILRQFIQEQVDQLPPAEQEIVEAASVAGIEFCVSAVAAALNRPLPEIETQCATMAQAGRFFASAGWSCWPDGTVCQRYCFIYSLYCEVIYKRLAAGQRARWHLRIGVRLERALAGLKEQAAPELAHHFQRGCDARRAIHYLKQAAQQCLERGTAADAVRNVASGLELLPQIPEQEERRRLVLELRGQYRKARELMGSHHPSGII
ncbi:MAG TPA: hypothetical protein VKE93_00910 [Candidatus Angelobacter sp.]|nr:hypothetical protein [Candidatus Angelobacter sp.]